MNAPSAGVRAAKDHEPNTAVHGHEEAPNAEGLYPLSFAQQRLWLLDQLEPDNPAYNMRGAYRVSGPLNVNTLQDSLNEIVRRHEPLRAAFAAVDGRPVQRIAETLILPLSFVDLLGFSEGERETELHRRMTQEVQRLFNLAESPLIRVTLFRMAQREHVLLLVMHHIVSDGWSMGVFLGELLNLYDSFSRGEPSTLPPLPWAYHDFARRQRQELTGEVLENLLAYWKGQLHGAPQVLELPTDRPRPAIQTFVGDAQSITLPTAMLEKLESFSRRESATLFMTLLAAWTVVLRVYSGQEDIVIGAPIANRNRPDVEQLIGFFVNSLVLRIDLSGDPTFRELLRRVRGDTLDAYDHQDMPFEKLVEELQPPRDLRFTPLFQVMLLVENMPMPVLQRAGLTFTFLDVNPGTSRFDVSLFVWKKPEGLKLAAEYNRDLFDAATMTRMLEHVRQVLEDVLADADRPLSRCSILTPSEKHQLTFEWNRTERDYPAACIHEFFEAQVERTPHAVAVIDGSQRLTLRELNRRANRLAHYLRKRGVEPGHYVGVYLERTADAIISLLAVLKAGAAYLPMDPNYPQARLAFMLMDAEPRLVLTAHSRITDLTEPRPSGSGPLPHGRRSEIESVCLDTEWEAIANESDENPIHLATPDPRHRLETGATQAAYVIYSSGSTGKPKGVLGLHQGAVNRCAWMWERYPFRPDEVCCQKTTLSFVDAVAEIFCPLLAGIPLVIIPDEVLGDLDRLLNVLGENGVTRITLVPSLLRVILDGADDLAERVPKLRLWVCSGETLPPDLCRRFRARMPHAQLLNLYGSSEDSADVTAYDTSVWDPACATVPMGRPIANTRAYILDAHQQPVPIGVAGDLYFGGAGLARSYLNRPELTREKFIPDPFLGDGDSRLYQTGDRARYLPDGNIEFLGRSDFQVKIRGIRIELGEIETALNEHPDVRQAVLVVREDGAGDSRLVAYIVPRSDQTLNMTELRQFLQERLPSAMIPSAFVSLNALPLSPNGKIDRQALPAPSQTRSTLVNGEAPKTPMERAIAEIWKEALSVDGIGVYSTFYDLGGHSLLSIAVLETMRKRLHVRIHPRDLLLQSLGQLAAGCDERLRTASGTNPTPFARRLLNAAQRWTRRR